MIEESRITREIIIDAARISQKIKDIDLEDKSTRPPREPGDKTRLGEYKIAVAEYNKYYTRYIDIIKRQYIDEFKENHNNATPNVLMKNILGTYLVKHKLDNKYEVKHFPFRGGEKYHCYEWACIIPRRKRRKTDSYATHAYLPQLYILISQEGLKFGFVYGAMVEASDPMVQAVIYDISLQKYILNTLKTKENNICLDNGQHPFQLPNDETKINISKSSDISENWEKRLRFVGYYYLENIPKDIHNEIIKTLNLVLPVFTAVSSA